MSSIHVSGPARKFKTCPCGTMAKCNAQKACHSCGREFISNNERRQDGRGRLTKRCQHCGLMAPSNRTAVCACGQRFPVRSRSNGVPRQVRRVQTPPQQVNNLENFQEIWNVPTVPQPSRQNSLQDVVDVLMRAPILFDENSHSEGLIVPEDGLSDFFDFDHFFDQAIIDENTPNCFQTSPPVCV